MRSKSSKEKGKENIIKTTKEDGRGFKGRLMERAFSFWAADGGGNLVKRIRGRRTVQRRIFTREPIGRANRREAGRMDENEGKKEINVPEGIPGGGMRRHKAFLKEGKGGWKGKKGEGDNHLLHNTNRKCFLRQGWQKSQKKQDHRLERGT